MQSLVNTETLLTIIHLNVVTVDMLTTNDVNGQFCVEFKDTIDRDNFCLSIQDITVKGGCIRLHMDGTFIASSCNLYHLGTLLLQEQLVVKERAMWEKFVDYCVEHSTTEYYSTDLVFSNSGYYIETDNHDTFTIKDITLPVLYERDMTSVIYKDGRVFLIKDVGMYCSSSFTWNTYFSNKNSHFIQFRGLYVADKVGMYMVKVGDVYEIYHPFCNSVPIITLNEKTGDVASVDSTFCDLCKVVADDEDVRIPPTLWVKFHFREAGKLVAVVNGVVMTVEQFITQYPEHEIYLSFIEGLII